MLIIGMKNLNRMEMVGMSKIFLFPLLCSFALTFVVQAQDTSGFISIDCGIADNSSYTDSTTNMLYTSDTDFADCGVSKTISPQYQISTLDRQFFTVRSFPDGDRNCYTLWPSRGRGNKYLVRARFMYGNYDAKNQLPEFDLYIGVNFWDTVQLDDLSTPRRYEIIHVPVTDYVTVCLVSKNHGTPFISTLELRPLKNSIYTTKYGSLNFYARADFGSTSDGQVRYKDDVYDRIWAPLTFSRFSTLMTNSTVDPRGSNDFVPPSIVMSTAMVPSTSSSDSMDIGWEPKNVSDQFYIYLHITEIQVLKANQSRQFNIYLNDKLWYKSFVPDNLSTTTIYSDSPEDISSFYEIKLNKTSNSTLPPLINAFELYTVKNLSDALTDDKDFNAMLRIKSMYGLSRNWQGDPCGPKAYVWVGITCSYNSFNPPRIISLDLSSSGLTGVITPFIANLTMLQTLDLSNNNFTGPVPVFLSRMDSLKVLNLKGNNFSSVPKELIANSKSGSLTLSIDSNIEGENNNTSSQSPPSKKKGNKNIVIPIAAAVGGVAVLIIAALVIAFCVIKRRKPQEVRRVDPEINNRDRAIEGKNRQFTYSEVLGMTNNFQRVIGKGGFGTVYYGCIGDTQVAVKMLSPSSIQGYKEFQAEANLLLSVHHKNLTSLVGYCNEGTNMGIIYEYMANGNLSHHLSDKNPNALSWDERLRISMDAAQGLEYLHHGCTPPIVHRDVKTTNILLNEHFKAKLADFGLSKAFPSEGGTPVSTIIAGTPGYLDPDYYTSNRLAEKSDVYSFGVVILEMITGRPAIPKGIDSVHIIQWVNSRLTIGDITNVVDPRLKGDYDVNSVWKAIEIALACVSRNPTRRPAMNYVVLELKECLAMETARTGEMESDNTMAMTSMNIESGLGPLAR